MTKRKNNTERRLEFVKEQTKLGNSENALRAKYIEMRDGKITREENLKDIFKPVTIPIYKILNATFEKVKQTDGSVDYIPRFVTPKNISDFSDKLSLDNQTNTDNLIRANLQNTEDLITSNAKRNKKLTNYIKATNRHSANIEDLLVRLNISVDGIDSIVSKLTNTASPSDIKQKTNSQLQTLLDLASTMDIKVENGEIDKDDDSIEELFKITKETVDLLGDIEILLTDEELFYTAPIQTDAQVNQFQNPLIDVTEEDDMKINDTDDEHEEVPKKEKGKAKPLTMEQLDKIVVDMYNHLSYIDNRPVVPYTAASYQNRIRTDLAKFLEFYERNANYANRGQRIDGKTNQPKKEDIDKLRDFLSNEKGPIGLSHLFSAPNFSIPPPPPLPALQSSSSSTGITLRPRKGKGNIYGNGLIDFKTGLFSGSPLKVDMNLLKNNHLKVTKKGVLMINKKVDPDTVAILTTPSHAMKKYSPLAIKTFQDMYKMSKSVIGSGCDKERFLNMKNVLLISSPTDAVKKLEIIHGAMKTGNTSDVLKGQASEIIDYLLKEKKIDKADHKALFNKFMII